MTSILVLRHAPTDWNRAGRIQGRADVSLSPEGEAAAAGWRLPPQARGWRVVASPLLRAIRTAELMGLSPEPFAPLVEMDWGRLEGQRLADVRAARGAAFAAEEALGLDFRPDGGETPREVGLRALTGLQSLSGDAVAITHKGVLRALFALALDWDMRSKSPVRTLDAACHRFSLDAGGVLALAEPNIPLADRGPLMPSAAP